MRRLGKRIGIGVERDHWPVLHLAPRGKKDHTSCNVQLRKAWKTLAHLARPRLWASFSSVPAYQAANAGCMRGISVIAP